MEKGRNPKRVKGFRLPKLTRRYTEMGKLRKWVESLTEEELEADNAEEAINRCAKIIAEFEVRKKRKKGLQEIESSQNANVVPPSQDITAVGGDTISNCPQCSFPLQIANRQIQGDNEPSNLDPQNSIHETRILSISTDPQTEGSNVGDTVLSSLPANPTPRELLEKEILDSAKDESLFIMLCEIFDDSRESPYGWWGGQFLREYQRKGQQPTPLVKEILTYCYGRRYGARDALQHQRSEDTLRYHLGLLKKARRALRLPGYEELRWRYKSTSHHYAGV